MGSVRLGLFGLVLTSALALAPHPLGATTTEELAPAEQSAREQLTITISTKPHTSPSSGRSSAVLQR